MTHLVVGVADGRVSNDPEAVLHTYALGSCVALAIYDPVARLAGLVHFMLPESSLDLEKARQNPWMFADTGIPLLFRKAYEMGAEKRRMAVYAAGGAQLTDERGIFNIGKRNCLAMRKLLWRAGVMLREEIVGGNTSRNLRLEVSSGRLWLRDGIEPERELRGLAEGLKGIS